MIRVKCNQCGKSTQAKDEYAGRKAKCPNCGSPIVVPSASASAPSPPAAQAPAPNSGPAAAPPLPTSGGTPAPNAPTPQPAGQTIVVQMQQQPGGGMIGPEPKSLIVVWLLSCVCAGLQSFYLGQMGKGVLFTLLTLLFWGPVICLTCGIGLIGAAPYGILLLVDSLVVAGRMRTQAISPWRFF